MDAAEEKSLDDYHIVFTVPVDTVHKRGINRSIHNAMLENYRPGDYEIIPYRDGDKRYEEALSRTVAHLSKRRAVGILREQATGLVAFRDGQKRFKSQDGEEPGTQMVYVRIVRLIPPELALVARSA